MKTDVEKTEDELITEQSLIDSGYSAFVSKSMDYEDGNLLTFGVADRLDMYYVQSIKFCELVTGNTMSRGNRILFRGKVETMDELKWLIKDMKTEHFIEERGYFKNDSLNISRNFDDDTEFLKWTNLKISIHWSLETD